jgi:two-component system CheB/CheR fusion protein
VTDEPDLPRIKVLHIEDDSGVARNMARLLRLYGYEVVTAATRDEAIQHVAVNGLRPDLILIDYLLPDGITGDNVVAEIVARLPFKPPTIMLAGVMADRDEKAKSSVDRFLSKPVEIDVLVREIESLLGKRR